METFAEYLQDTSFSATQFDFINLIIARLTATGTMELRGSTSHRSPNVRWTPSW